MAAHTFHHSSQPVEDIAWLSEWELPFEGGYSLLSKFAWANSASAGELCNFVFRCKLLTSNNFGSHGRSLLDMGWVNVGTKSSVPYLREKVMAGSFSSHAGRWTHYIAADDIFRFCRCCLEHGYQSAFFQIDGLISCPIHGCPLEASCSHCGAPTHRYAITKDGFATPFHCSVCQHHLARSFEPNAWTDAAFRQAAYDALTPLAKWLQQLASTSLKWVDWSDWHFPLRWHSNEKVRRIATLDVLLKVFPPLSPIAGLRLSDDAPQVYVGEFKKPQNLPVDGFKQISIEDVIIERSHLYKAVRRYLTKRMRGCRNVTTKPLPKIISVSQSDGSMQLNLSSCARAQCLALWRFHFELEQHDRHILTLRRAVLQWPTSGMVDLTTWGNYLLVSFYAAAAAFDAWRSQAIKLADAELLGRDRASARALHAQYAPLLNPTILPSFPAVSILTFTDEHNQARLIIVGPRDIAANEKIGESGIKLWCKCRSSCDEKCDGGLHKSNINVMIVKAMQCHADFVNLAYIVPMDQMILPPSLDGSASKAYRDAMGCSLLADNDLQAISLWLDDCKSTSTRDAYKRNIEKALVWCVAQRGKAISQMNEEDVNAFAAFLADPLPRDVWLPTQNIVVPHHWSPFRKANETSTQYYTLEILYLIFQAWYEHRYVNSNPFRQYIQQGRTLQQALIPEFAQTLRETRLTMIEWRYLLHAVGSPLDHTSISIIIRLAYYAALTPKEIASIRLGALRRYPTARHGTDIWSVTIPTRNPERKEVFLIKQISSLLTLLFPTEPDEFSAFVTKDADIYLIDLFEASPQWGRMRTDIAPTGQAFKALLKPFFAKAAQLASAAGDSIAEQRLRHATLSWLSDAFEFHLNQAGKKDQLCWSVIGAWKRCPACLRDYLPDRCIQNPSEIEKQIAELSLALDE